MSKVLYFSGIVQICKVSNTILKNIENYLTRYKSVCIINDNITETNVSERYIGCYEINKIRRIRTMVNVTSTYLTATQVMEILGVSRATAYKTIYELNEELQQKGYRIIAGKVPAKYFEEKYYGLQVMQ